MTARQLFPMPAVGTPLPTERRLSGRIDHDRRDALRAAPRAAFLLRSLCQAPRLEPANPHRRRPLSLASLQDRQGQAQARHRSHARDSPRPRRFPHRHRAGFRHRGGRDGALVAPGRAARHGAGLGIVRGRLGHRHHQAAQAQGCGRAQGTLRGAAGSLQGRSRNRCGLHLEWHHLGGAGAQCRLDRRRSGGPRHLRCDLGCLRAAARFREARCRDAVLAEGVGRRGGARHADAVAACGRAAQDLHPALAAAEALPHDQWRQAHGGPVRGRDHQHALDAVCGGLSRHARLGKIDRRPRCAHWSRRCQCQGHRRLGGGHALDRFSGPAAADPLQHLGLPQDRRSGREGAGSRRAVGLHQGPGGAAREGERRLRHRRLSRRAAGAARVVRLDRRGARHRGAHAMARLGLRARQGCAAQGGVRGAP